MMLLSTLLLVGQVLAATPAHLVPAAVPRAASFGQTLRGTPAVAGRVVTELGAPLPGVVVAVQGTPHATSTNASGDFVVTLVSANSVLMFKCQGYRDQSLTLSNGNPLTVKMYAVGAATAAAPVAAGPAPTETTGQPVVLNFSEELPTFSGGDAGYRKYISQNARFPEGALAERASGTVYISFVVDEQGRVIDAAVSRGCGHGFDEEALRLIRLMPWWNPGRMAGKPVRVSRVLPVPFVFRERD